MNSKLKAPADVNALMACKCHRFGGILNATLAQKVAFLGGFSVGIGMISKNALTFGAMIAVVPVLTACGGGGGGAVATVPQTPSAVFVPPPASPPPPPAPVDYNTQEYQRSNAATKVSAITAYNAGATGQGVTAAVIDSGVNASLAEFAGRISVASRDVAGNRGMGDEDGHGTSVAAVLLGAKNDSDTHGVAFNATLLALRTDTPGSCSDTSPDGGCSHNDIAIASALDIAVSNGAKVVNLSLGGTAPNSTLRAAMGRATAAGTIIVISSGNDGLANPDNFALIANDAAARNLIIIAGGVDEADSISVFSTGGSNRAGIAASHFVVALANRVRTINETGAAVLASGTSYAAPAVSGAIALLAQAFPSLTSAQIVDLILSSARDLGAAGVDSVYGHGLLDLASAFAARGSSSVAGTAVPVSMTDNGSLSAPMGDASLTGLSTVFQDAYGRAYQADLEGTFSRAYSGGRLWSSLNGDGRTAGVGLGQTGAALSVSGDVQTGQVGPLALSAQDQRGARAMAGWVVSRLSRDTTFAAGFARSSGALIDQMAVAKASQFLVAEAAGSTFGFRAAPGYSGAVRQQIGKWGLSAGWDRGEALVWSQGLRHRYDRLPYTAASVSLDRRFGPLSLGMKASQLSEKETVLGARFGAMLGAPGAVTRLLFAAASYDAPMGWTLRGSWQQGWTRVNAGGVRPSADHLASSAWSFDATRGNLFARGDSFGLRLAQPVRVSAGGFNVELPVAWDYASSSAQTAFSRIQLSPTGRETDAEVHYAVPLRAGSLSTSLFWRDDPGHFEAAPDDVGAALRFGMAF